MPDRMLKADFGEADGELDLPVLALLAYPYLQRPCDTFGCARDNAAVIRAKAFPGRETPTTKEVAGMLDAYEKADLIDRYQGPDGQRYLFFRRWFRDNRFRPSRPTAPMPPSLNGAMTPAAWASGDPTAFAPLISAAQLEATDSGEAPPSAAKRGGARPKGKERKGIQRKGGRPPDLPDDFPYPEFVKAFRDSWSRRPSENQTKRAVEMWRTYGWPQLKAAIETLGGDYGFQWTLKVLKGEWNQGKARAGAGGRPGRHHVDER